MRKNILLLWLLLLPIVASAQLTFSLEAYRDSVYLNSTALGNASIEVGRAAARERIARVDFLPSLSASTSFTIDFRHSDGADLWGFTLQPRVEQILYGGGGIRSAYRRAVTQKQMAEQDELMAFLEERYAADKAYYTLSAMQLYKAATEEYTSIIRSLCRIVEERFREGYVAKSDLLQVQTRLSEAEYSLLEMANDYEVALHRFNNLRGVIDSSDVVLKNSIIDSLTLPVRMSVRDIFERRPDMRAAMLAIGSAEQGVNVVRSQYNPRLTAGVSGSWQTYSPNSSGKTYLDGALIVGLNVPIFHWGERRSAVAVAKADVARAENGVEQLMRDVAQQEADGWSAMMSSYSQIQSSLQNLQLAGENLTISTYSYQEGRATVLDVLQAQISWLQLYTNAITARFNYALSVADYQRITAHE